MSDLVGNPEGWFSHDAAHLCLRYLSIYLGSSRQGLSKDDPWTSYKESLCVGNCPPNCYDYIANGRHTGCLGGGMCSYECDKGYEATAGMLTCQLGVLKPFDPWALHNGPLCKPKPCPEVIPNGGLSENCTAKVGFNCQYACDEGFSKSRGITEIKCDSTTKWSPNAHSLCKKYNQCPYDIPGTDLDLSCRRSPGEQCEYTCREGYVHSHYATADCRSTGEWMQRIDSFCIEIKCPLFLDHGTIQYPCTGKYGETCSYKCSSSYTKPPLPPSLKCNASQQLDHMDTTGFWEWDKAMGQPCVRKGDICPSTFPNGSVPSACHRQPGAVCYYTCKAGCDKNPTVTKIHCRQSNGIWMENTDNLCTNCIRCPENIDNGQVVLSCERLPFTDCSYTCNSGWRKTVATLYCPNDGHWSDRRPCICENEDAGSPNSDIVVPILFLTLIIILLFLSGVWSLRRLKRQRMNRQAASAREHENRGPIEVPSAPLDGRSSPPSYESEIQRMPVYNNTNGRQGPSGYNEVATAASDGSQVYPASRTAQTQDTHISRGISEYPGSGNDTTISPPPSYEEVIADPTRFKT